MHVPVRPKYSIEDFDAYVMEKFTALRGQAPSVVLGAQRVGLAPWEADWFLQGVRDLRLFDVAVHTCRSGFVAAGFEGDVFKTPSGRARDVHLFANLGGVRRILSREVVTHLAALARLVGQFGHRAATVRAESDRFEVDIVAFDRPADDHHSQPILGVEVKVGSAEHDELVAGMQACGGIGGEDAHRMAARRLPGSRSAQLRNHHRKCVWVAANLPGTFWIVSPRNSNVLSVRPRPTGGYELLPLDEEALMRASVELRGSGLEAGGDRLRG